MSEFRPVLHDGVAIGKEYFSDGAHIFFGNKRGTLAILEKSYPHYRFNFVKQVHGDRILHAPDSAEADAHWTEDSNQALGIYTADCLPVLINWPSSKKVLAIHAGWRGLVSEIISKSIQKLGVEIDTCAFIGPHIRGGNFEVGNDVATALAKAGDSNFVLPHPSPNKKFVDLTETAKLQLSGSGIKTQNISVDPDETFNNPNYFSYRGDRAGCGRLISFICWADG